MQVSIVASMKRFRQRNTGQGSRLWCVVLAAGGSRRLGRPKQLLRHQGRPLLAHTVAAALDIAPGRVLVVVGAYRQRISTMLRRHRLRTAVVVNPRWRTGLSTSLRAGLRALPTTASAAMVLLSDQPFVDRHAMRRLRAVWLREPRTPAAACWDDRVGVPAVLPRSVWTEAARAQGDNGARAMLRGMARINPVNVPEAAIDIDSPADSDLLRVR